MRNLILAISVIALIGCGGEEADNKTKSRSRTKNKAEASKEEGKSEDAGFD